jgi:hypothetical protein
MRMAYLRGISNSGRADEKAGLPVESAPNAMMIENQEGKIILVDPKLNGRYDRQVAIDYVSCCCCASKLLPSGWDLATIQTDQLGYFVQEVLPTVALRYLSRLAVRLIDFGRAEKRCRVLVDAAPCSVMTRVNFCG